MAFDSKTLEADISALEARLAPSGDDGDLKKALTDVANGAIKLASQSLNKARGEEEDDEGEGEEDDDSPRTEDDDTEDWIQNLLQNKGGDRADKSRAWGDLGSDRAGGLSKALHTEGDVGAVDVGGYLQDELAIRERDRKELRRLRKTTEVLLKGLAGIHKLLKDSTGTQQRVNGVLSKGLLKLLDQAEDFAGQPVGGSRFALMEKSSLAAAREHLRANGGQQVPYDPNRAFEMLKKGFITQVQQTAWKRTGYLPPGVDAA